MTGREFENACVKSLHKDGFWVHRIHPDESGQQPFDIIAIRGSEMCFFDAKVVTDKVSFPFSRIEDNQMNAFELVQKKTHASKIGLLIYWDDGVHNDIRYMSLERIHTETWMGKKSIKLASLSLWRES